MHGLAAALAARVPVRIAHYHGFTDWPEKRRFLIAERLAAPLATDHISISARPRPRPRAARRDQGAVRDRHLRHPAGKEPPPPPAEPRLLAIGRFVGFKGFDLLLRAFPIARRQVPELTLEIAGAGPLEPSLRPLTSDGVTWLGDVRPVQPVLERNAVLVAPSLAEGLGLVALEAHERGRAAIVSASGGLPEIVADGETGIVVPVGSVDALAEAIVELASDPGRVAAMGTAARRRVLEEFPESRPADALDAFYRRLGLPGGR